jgi:hypothetical protein
MEMRISGLGKWLITSLQQRELLPVFTAFPIIRQSGPLDGDKYTTIIYMVNKKSKFYSFVNF